MLLVTTTLKKARMTWGDQRVQQQLMARGLAARQHPYHQQQQQQGRHPIARLCDMSGYLYSSTGPVLPASFSLTV